MIRLARKPHVHVDPERYVAVLDEVGCARLDDLAEFLNVSQASARRRLDGLVYQGRVKLLRERPREYGKADTLGAANDASARELTTASNPDPEEGHHA